MNKEELGAWLVTVVSGLVSRPDEVEVTNVADEQGVLYTIRVAPVDTGKVIGKKGTIAQALRTILRSAGYLGDIRASMKVDAPGSDFQPTREY